MDNNVPQDWTLENWDQKEREAMVAKAQAQLASLKEQTESFTLEYLTQTCDLPRSRHYPQACHFRDSTPSVLVPYLYSDSVWRRVYREFYHEDPNCV